MAKRPKKTSEIELPPPDPVEVPRPIALASVIGQEKAIGILLDSLRAGRVHHAWLFHGPPGVGKFTAALAYAALLLDPTTQATFSGDLAPDPDSQVQRLLSAGSHPDLFIVAKELAKFHEDSKVRDAKQTVIPVHVIRQFLIDPAKIGPTLRNEAAIGKVFIVDEAELMKPPSQNAVLKLLEEPPERVAIILVTSSEERMLPTIRSRCQRVYFGPLSARGMEEWLGRQSELSLNAEERAWLLKFADGSPGVLRLAHEGGIFAWWERLKPMLQGLERGIYAVEMGPAMAEMIEAWAKAWVAAHANASKDAANKAGADWMLRLLAGYWRDRLRVAVPVNKAGPYLAAIDAVRAAEPEIDANVNMLFVMEMLASELVGIFAQAAASPAR